MRSGAEKRGKNRLFRPRASHWLLRAEMFQGVAHWRSGNFDTVFAIVSDESPISAGATFYTVDASNGLMTALATLQSVAPQSRSISLFDSQET